jgi:hypothetical protein
LRAHATSAAPAWPHRSVAASLNLSARPPQIPAPSKITLSFAKISVQILPPSRSRLPVE